ncbi:MULTISPECIES: hypothetical protein [Vibrio]|uniref:Uncharacterized protein n=2 Tax=Vibrio TaxID=662 RepID=A0A1B1LRP3_VIBPH|nr:MULTISPECIES: hypothetical protein [Vibrio]KOO06963.1 hypothetical protein AKJ31_14805 [Vibrio hepatarius]POC39120.1 hypothetical protein CRN55_07790 [Vibrio vulnificus]BEI26282.1 hypothetical protein KKIDH5335_46140 [Vibrio fluvialis]ANS55710.1 hypothetical protein [Vibrio parahaemolyticus]PNV69306.1 hypothetical protein C1Y48_18895 [Vibrio cholerae]
MYKLIRKQPIIALVLLIALIWFCWSKIFDVYSDNGFLPAFGLFICFVCFFRALTEMVKRSKAKVESEGVEHE